MIKKAIFKAKRRLVIALESSCELTGHHFCNLLAAKSANLDRKWGTDVWLWVSVADAEEETT